jgi:hypothetical protein
MKPSLHLKTAVVIVYVLACTQLVMMAHEADTGYVTDVADTTALRLRTVGFAL